MEPKQSTRKKRAAGPDAAIPDMAPCAGQPNPAGRESESAGHGPRGILTVNPIRMAYRLNYVANFYTGPLYKEIERRWELTRPEYIVLFCLLQTPRLLAKDIVAICGRPKNSISRAVNALIGRGLIQADLKASGRGQPLTLTAAGETIAKDILPLFIHRERQMLEPLDAEERAQFDRLLGKLCLRDDGWDRVY